MTGPASTTGPTRRRSFASSGLTYDEVARQLGLRLCAGSCPLALGTSTASRALESIEQHEKRHREGWVTIYPRDPDKVVHWSHERTTRRGLYQFLRLASYLLYPDDVLKHERWLALYLTDWHARRLARKLRVRIPADYGKREKARVRLDLAKLTPTEEDQPWIKKVRTWVRT